MAEQVLRRAVDIDRDVLLKSIETIIFRAERGTRFTVTANPEDVPCCGSIPRRWRS